MAVLLFNHNYDKNLGEVNLERILEMTSAEEADISDFLIVLPTGRQVFERKRQYVRRYFEETGKPAQMPDMHTIQTLAGSILRGFKDDDVPVKISEAYRRALFEEAVENADIEFFLPKKGKIPPATVERLERIISGLKEDGITPEKIREDLAREESEEITDRNKLADIEKIYSKYQELLGDRYLDEVELLIRTCRKMRQFSGDTEKVEEPDFYGKIPPAEKHIVDELFAKKKLILFIGFSEFKHYETEFVSLFASARVPVLVNVDYHTENGPLFAGLDEPVVKLTQFFNRLDTNPDETGTGTLSNSEYLRRYLFNTEENKIRPELAEMIEVYRTTDRKSEISFISKYIRFLAEKKGYKPQDIAIVARKPEIYSRLFRETFYLDSVPFDISDRTSLRTSPVTSAVFSVISMLTKGFRRADVYKTLRSAYTSFSSNEIAIDADNLLDIAEETRISGGNRYGGGKFWINRISTYIEYLSGLIQKNEVFEDELESERINEQLRKAEKALEDFKVIYNFFDVDFNRYFKPAEFRDLILDSIVAKLNIEEKITRDYRDLLKTRHKKSSGDYLLLHDTIERDVKAFKKFKEVLNETCFILADRYPEREFRGSELIAKLNVAVEGEKYQIREKRGFGVTVTSIEQLRGIENKVIILCGAVAGEFPMNYSTDKFLGKELPDSEIRQLAAERMQFYQFLTSNKKALDRGANDGHPHKIIMTFPASNGENSLIPSNFIYSLLNIAIESDTIFPPDREQSGSFIKNVNPKSNTGELSEISRAVTNKAELISLYVDNLGNKKLPELDDPDVKREVEEINNINNRKSPEVFFYYESLSQNDKKKLARLSLRRKSFSASELETYIACPYRYYVERLLRLAAKESSDDEAISHLEKGSLMHMILYVFFSLLQKREEAETWLTVDPVSKQLPKVRPVRLYPEKKTEYAQLLRRIAEEEFKDFYKENPFLKLEYVSIIGSPEKPGRLDLWLEAELQRIERGFDMYPSAFELAFGSGNPAIPPIEINGVKIKGKIDRVEFRSGRDNSGNRFLIADYKSKIGKSTPALKDVKAGESLQIPLYIYVTKILLRDYFRYYSEPGGGVYYSLSPKKIASKEFADTHRYIVADKDLDMPGFENHLTKNGSVNRRSPGGLVNNREELEECLDIAAESAENAAKSIESYDFRPNPDKNTCMHCSFGGLCRKRIS